MTYTEANAMAVNVNWNTNNYLTLTFSDDISGKDLRQVIAYLGGDHRLDYMRYLLCDWRPVSSTLLTIEDVENFAAHISAIAKSHARVAQASIMQSKEESRQSLFSLYGFLLQECPWQVALFNDELEVKAWFDSISV
jgi:hypothetical protein